MSIATPRLFDLDQRDRPDPGRALRKGTCFNSREMYVSKDGNPATHRIDQFLLGPGGRADDWRDLVEAALPTVFGYFAMILAQ
jgi:arginine decarboxylase